MFFSWFHESFFLRRHQVSTREEESILCFALQIHQGAISFLRNQKYIFKLPEAENCTELFSYIP